MELDLSQYIRKKTAAELLDENNNEEDFTKNPLITTKSIKEYFDGSNIFVTGSTGFLGKVLIEKLLRSCNGINRIYILLRSKRGIGSEKRFEEFIKNKVFDNIREKTPEVLLKLVCIPGDIIEPNLGLDENDRKTLENNIDIVFHVAATVKFNEPLKDAANLNTFGTERVMKLCLGMTNLKSLVHVSTAYSNPYLRKVGEQVYGSTAAEDHQMFINGVGVLPDDFVDTITERYQKKHPNTYTLTKHYAEQIVVDYHEKLPLCIVRPSIVTPAVHEPFPGWIDNFCGVTGVLMEISRGTISSVVGDADLRVDLIPVDVVCNTIITAAWSNSFTRSNIVPVYNCTSGQATSFRWSDLAEGIMKYSRKFPTKYIMFYPKYSHTTNIYVHWLKEILLHFLPAIVFDFMLRLQRKKAFMFRLAKKFRVAIEAGTYFAMNEWDFEARNLQRLGQAARETQLDAQEFSFEMANMDWDSYMEKYWLGIRTFVLKDDLSSLPKARKKLQQIVWTKRIFQMILCALFYYAIFHGFGK